MVQWVWLTQCFSVLPLPRHNPGVRCRTPRGSANQFCTFHLFLVSSLMQAPAPGGAQTITVYAPQYPGYGLRDPNDCGECNPCALFVNFFVVLLLGYLGTHMTILPKFGRKRSSSSNAIVSNPQTCGNGCNLPLLK